MHAFYYGHSSLVFSHVHRHNLLVSLHVDQPDEDQLQEHMMAGLTWQLKLIPCWLCSQEWPEIVYPTYANGPGYIVSQDIAHFIASCYRNDTLRV